MEKVKKIECYYNNCVYLLKEIIFSNYIGCLSKKNLLINIGV